MKGKRCFFIGHCETSDKLFPILQDAVKKHIEDYEVTEFIVGNHGNFDRLAATAIINAKQLYPEIILSLLTPYHPAERPIKKPNGFDNILYPYGMETVPRKLAIVYANRYMVNSVDYLIAYAWHPASNAQELVEYAKKQSEKGFLKVTNLALSHHEL